MTVADLIAALQKLPQNLPVALEDHERFASSEVAGIREDQLGDTPRVYIQYFS